MALYIVVAIAGALIVVAVLRMATRRSSPAPAPAPPLPPAPALREQPVDQAVANILAAAAAQENDSRTNEDMVDDALRVVTAIGGVSVPALQRKLRIDFARATALVAMLEERGYVSPPGSSHKRKVLPAALERVAVLEESD